MSSYVEPTVRVRTADAVSIPSIREWKILPTICCETATPLEISTSPVGRLSLHVTVVFNLCLSVDPGFDTKKSHPVELAIVAIGSVTVTSPQQKPENQSVSYVRDFNGCLVEICSPASQ